MPELWRDARAAPWQVQTDLLIPEKDIRIAFARLIRNRTLAAKHCFCFFIDGLDEYQATAQKDHKELVGLLTGWTATAPQDVKLCVSSREYNVFMNAFSEEKRLRIHELTRFDIEAYAQDKLGDVSDQKAKKTLISAIVDKAAGIFLWVALVVKEMRDHLEDGADSAALMQLVDSLPDELDSLYEHILRSLSKPDRRKAYRTLAMLALCREWELPLSLLAYSFLDKYDANTAFAEQDDFVQTGRGGMSDNERIELGRKRVNGWCRGLVEAADSKLNYSHRSVPDFLEHKTVKDEMESSLSGFNAADALSQLVLAEFRLPGCRASAKQQTAFPIGRLVDMRRACGLDHAPFAFLRSLDASVHQPLGTELETGSINAEVQISLFDEGSYTIARTMNDPKEHIGSIPLFKTHRLLSALHYCAFRFADHGYPAWTITNDPTATDSAEKVALLAYTVFIRHRFKEKINWYILDALLDRGLLSPRTRTRLAPICTTEGEFARDQDPSSDNEDHDSGADSDTLVDTTTAAVPKYGEIELSVWQHYLIGEWLFQQNALSMGTSLSQQDRHARFSAVAERFLRRGGVAGSAESRFTVSVSRQGEGQARAVFCFGGGDPAGDEGTQNLAVSSCWVSVPRWLPLDKVKVVDTVDPGPGGTAMRQETEPRVWLLRSWIEGLDGSPNKEELLRLVDGDEPSPRDVRPDSTAPESDLSPPVVVGSKVSGLGTIGVGYLILLALGKYLLSFTFFVELENMLTALSTSACFFDIQVSCLGRLSIVE